jgi:tetratricopeptide (TPR) repeat protein
LLAARFGKTNEPAQVKAALALALLRVPLLPEQISPAKDALLDMAGETAALLVAGRFDQALQLFQRILRDYPDTPYLRYAYGSALDFRQQYEEAGVQLREQIRLTPGSVVAQVRLGAVLLKLHRPAEALPIARRAVELDAESAISHQLLGRILTEVGQTEESTRETELAKKAGPQKYEVDSEVARMYLANSTPAPPTAADDPGRDNSRSRPDFAALAEKARLAGRLSEAIQYYRDALKENARWEQGWADLGIVLYASGRAAEAIPALTTSLSLNRRRAEAWVFLGLSEFETKDYQNSFLHLERGRELGFHGTAEAKKVASYNLAQLRNLNGDFEGSLDLLTSTAEPDQLTGSMKVVLGMALLRVPLLAAQIDATKAAMLQAASETAALLRQQKYDKTFRGLEQLLRNYPDTPFLHYAYGSALQTFSRFEEAEAQFKEEIRITPQSALPHVRLASIALTLHHPEDAATFAQRGVSLDPEAAGAHELLGRALLEMGKVDASIRELETASRLAPTYSEVHFDLARAYAKTASGPLR